MTQKSWWWDGNATGDSSLAPYDMEQWATIYKLMMVSDANNQGVIGGALDSLAVVASTAASVAIKSGAAIINGRLYYNDAPISMPVSGGSNYWLIGLVSSPNDHTIRAFSRGGYKDSASALASLVHLTTSWEIPLAVVLTSSAGTVASIDDRRLFVLRPEKLSRFVPAIGCYNQTDTVAVIQSDSRGFKMEDNRWVFAYGNLLVPNNYWKLLTTKAVVTSLATGDIYSASFIEYGSLHDSTEYYNQHTISVGYSATPVVVNNVTLVNTTPEINNLKNGLGAISDVLTLSFARDSRNALDTIGAIVYFAGWIVEYMVLF